MGREFMLFAGLFVVYPEIVSYDELIQIYKLLVRTKPLMDGRSQGIEFDDFKEALIRISVRGFDNINRIFNKEEAKNRTNTSIIDKSALNGGQKPIEPYQHLDDMTPSILEKLIIYLQLPQDKNEMIQRLNGLKIENKKTVPERIKAKNHLEKLYEREENRKIAEIDEQKTNVLNTMLGGPSGLSKSKRGDDEVSTLERDP
eukprot:TRINITY_DN5473_c0_g1_i6.p1 TRINITY_DN5473_c0_g1~~TRINITY_DN5473_c0_g1_i6.p1  ORF type:complete len:201 (-),score=54.28 TRINITY_DN5473_c0_g1_i6:160-762(-)